MNLGLLALTALPFVVSPGASFTITVSAIAKGQGRVALRVWAGTALGIALIAGVVAFSGVSRLIAENDLVRMGLGVVGGSVLIGFGVVSIFRSLGSRTTPTTAGSSQQRLVVWSFFAVITNFKALSLYALVVPTLVTAEFPGWRLYAAFALVHIVMLLAWLAVVGILVQVIPGLAESETARRGLVVVAAVALALLGAHTIVGALR